MPDKQVESVGQTHRLNGYWAYVIVLAAPTLGAVFVFKNTAFGDALVVCWLYIGFAIGNPIWTRSRKSIYDRAGGFAIGVAVFLAWSSLATGFLTREELKSMTGWGLLAIMLYVLYTGFTKWLLRRYFDIDIKSVA